jgi:hypothetical protein
MIPQRQSPLSGLGRFIGAVFGFVFGGIGLTVLGFLWGERGFGEPPLFFKLFGSFIAIAFVAFGATFFLAAIKGPGSQPESTRTASTDVAPGTGSGYQCPSCSARLGEGADVSPKGDVKCGYCKQWFNIHG